jgi:hypothetical protein
MRKVSFLILVLVLSACSNDAPPNEGGKRDRSVRAKAETAAPRASDNVAAKTVVDTQLQALERAKAVEAVQLAADRQRAIDAGLEAPQ